MTAPTLTFTNDPTKVSPTRHPDSPPEREPYVAEASLIEAVNLAIFLRRPLLLEGEAGCGKTRLARAVAHELGLPYYNWPVRSSSKATEGLYTYDAIRRLHDVQVLRAGNSAFWSRLKPSPAGSSPVRDPSNPAHYREFGALGRAFHHKDGPAVVLIDEIDKADIDFPNDLLTILDKPWEFHVPETDERVQAHPDALPIVFVTSNKEKGNLPAPFLRRCLYHYVEFPDDLERLRSIVLAHFPKANEGEPAELLQVALERFRDERRRGDLYKRPGTSELLDWLAALLGFRGQRYPASRLKDRSIPLPFPEVLFKVKADVPRRHPGGLAMITSPLARPIAPAARERLISVFARMRRRGVALGVAELLDAFRTLESGFASGEGEAFKRVVRRIWCRTLAEEAELDAAWEDEPSGFAPRGPALPRETPPPPIDESDDGPIGPTIPSRGASVSQGPEPAQAATWSPLPVRTPTPLDFDDDAPDLLADRPISRRAMTYAWRHLRRPLPDGPPDVLDVEATIARAERQGFLLAPVYRRRLRNHAHLVLFLDQNGSMTPFHRFTRDLLETARDESTIRRVDAVYFHDLPTLHDRRMPPGVHLDPHLTRPGDWNALAAGCSSETAALILSDAGAARGGWDPERVKLTVRFLAWIRRLTSNVAWLNPMPAPRWASTTAEAVASVVPMYPMEAEGLGYALDVLRGLTRPPDPLAS